MQPERVYIGGYEVRIEFVRQADMQLPKHVRYAAQQDMMGESEYDQLVIRVNAEMPPELQRSTLLHEMMHFLGAYGATVPPTIICTADDKDEAFASFMEKALWPVLADPRNLAVWVWLFGLEEAEDAVEEEGREEAYQEGPYPEAEAHVG